MKFILLAVVLAASPLGAQNWQLTTKSSLFVEYEDAQLKLLQGKDLLSRYPQIAEYQTKRVFSDGRYTITVTYLRRLQGEWQWAIKSRTDHLADGNVSEQNRIDDSNLNWVVLDPPVNKHEKDRLGRAMWLFSLK